jgi:hypothetical protein
MHSRSDGPIDRYRQTDESMGPPLWPSGQSSWLHILRYRVRFRRYQIFWEVVGLERGPLSLVSTTEDLLGRNSSGSGLENREYGRGDPLRWPRDTLCPQKLALTSPTSCGRSVGIVRLRTKATEFVDLLFRWLNGGFRQQWTVGAVLSTRAMGRPSAMWRNCALSEYSHD